MEINAKAKWMVNKANGRAVVFTARLKFKNEEGTQDKKCCYCTRESDYARLTRDQKFDDSVFTYFFTPEDLKTAIDGVGDFTLEDIVLSGFDFV